MADTEPSAPAVIRPQLTLTSFGYKYGAPPPEGISPYDCRTIVRNPFRFPKLRRLSGKDQEIKDFLLACGSTARLIDRLVGELKEKLTTIPAFHLWIGCHGGKHRSVALVELIKDRIQPDADVTVVHRDLDK